MIQLGQLSLFVMAQLASRLPFQSAYVSLHWTHQLNSFRGKKRGENTGERMEGAVEGKEWNKECSNNRIIHLNAAANYGDKYDFSLCRGSLWWSRSGASERCWSDWRDAIQGNPITGGVRDGRRDDVKVTEKGGNVRKGSTFYKKQLCVFYISVNYRKRSKILKYNSAVNTARFTFSLSEPQLSAISIKFKEALESLALIEMMALRAMSSSFSL